MFPRFRYKYYRFYVSVHTGTGANTDRFSRTLNKMAIRCVLLLSLVCMSMSFFIGSETETDHVALATSKVLERLEQVGSDRQTRDSLKPLELATYMIIMSDNDRDGQLDATELISFFTDEDKGGMDTTRGELIAGALLAEGDTDNNDKLDRDELTILIKEHGTF
ncbi:hypothetical protein ScPMuIL_003086 [Solemya velum]